MSDYKKVCDFVSGRSDDLDDELKNEVRKVAHGMAHLLIDIIGMPWLRAINKARRLLPYPLE